jgi:hypothetical protein
MIQTIYQILSIMCIITIMGGCNQKSQENRSGHQDEPSGRTIETQHLLKNLTALPVKDFFSAIRMPPFMGSAGKATAAVPTCIV